jgi:integrase
MSQHNPSCVIYATVPPPERPDVSGGRCGIGFREAAALYLQGGGESLYLRPLVDYFGDTPLAHIDQTAVDDAAQILKPLAAPSTRCRQVYTPISAITKYCAERGLCRWQRFRRPASSADRSWAPSAEEARRLARVCSNHIRPLVFLLFEGGRLGEALQLDWRQIDLDQRRIRFRRDRTFVVLPLHKQTVDALKKLPHREGAVFRTPANREYSSKRPSIKTAFKSSCQRAGIRRFSPRDCRRIGYPFDED